MASLDDILTSLKNVVTAANGVAQGLQRQVPTTTSGQLSANTLVQTGFVRVTGIAVVTAGAIGGLYDAATIAGAGSGQEVYAVAAAVGYTAVNMVFENGLVYKPGAGQVATIFYSRV